MDLKLKWTVWLIVQQDGQHLLEYDLMIRTILREVRLKGTGIRFIIYYYEQETKMASVKTIQRLEDGGLIFANDSGFTPTPQNAARCVIVKTFVTTDLQKAIAERNGLRCVETLTGFKYIGEKLGKYERALPAEFQKDYREQSESRTRELRLELSSYYVCGGEESYGYSAADFVRDKDGNGSAVVFAEVAAYAKSRGLTLPGLLDEIYAEYG